MFKKKFTPITGPNNMDVYAGVCESQRFIDTGLLI